MNCQSYITRLNKTHRWESKDQESPTDDEPAAATDASVDVTVNESIPTLLTKPELLKDPLLSIYIYNNF